MEKYEIYAEFTLGLRHRPAVPITHVFEPVELDESLMPGATVVGRLCHISRGQVIWVLRGVPQPARKYPELEGLDAHVFLTPGAEEFDAEEALTKVYRAAFLACLAHEAFGAINWRTGVECLYGLAQKPELSDEERRFQEALERLELFGLRCCISDQKHSVSLADLRRCPQIYLVDSGLDWDYLDKVKAEGAICLSGHDIVRRVLHVYGLPWEDEGALEDAVLGEARILPSKLRKQAVEVSFSSGVWSGERLEFPIYQREPLVFDFANGKVRGPLVGGSSLELSMNALLSANVDELEVMGEMKRHRYFFLHLSDGTGNLIFVERMKEYYEHCPGLRDMETRQDLATSVIHAIPSALGLQARLARPDLVSGKSLLELTKH